jgi:hypothetical protein
MANYIELIFYGPSLRQEYNKPRQGLFAFWRTRQAQNPAYVSMHTVKTPAPAYHASNSTRTGMDDTVHGQASLFLIDLQIEELEQRLNTLQEVILTMTAAGGDTTEQAELLLKMLKMRRALATFRAELKEDALVRHAGGDAP